MGKRVKIAASTAKDQIHRDGKGILWDDAKTIIKAEGVESPKFCQAIQPRTPIGTGGPGPGMV